MGAVGVSSPGGSFEPVLGARTKGTVLGCSVVTSFGNLIDSPPAPHVGVENGPPQKAGPTKKHETVHWDR